MRTVRTLTAALAALTLVPVVLAAPAVAASPAEPGGGDVQVASLVRGDDGQIEVRRTRAASVAEGRALAAQLRGRRVVVDAEVEGVVRAFADPRQPEQWGLSAVRAPEAWAAGDAAGQVLAVVDSGVDLDHPDLQPVLVPGRDYVDGDHVPEDANGHGTHVAGIAGAVAGNAEGGAGAALRARILPLRVLDATGGGRTGDVAAGIIYAVDAGATVVNLSLGGPTSSAAVANAVNYALTRGVPVVAAMGNESSSTPSYPAALPGVIAVGAVNRDGSRSSFSNTGSHLSVVGPGRDILSTYLGGSYVLESGTSMATPFVAAAVAHVRQANRYAMPDEVARHITRTATDLGATGFDTSYGFGRVQMAAATQSAAAAAQTAISRKHAQLGGDASYLGSAVSAESTVGSGAERAYQRGRIYWTSATGAWAVRGAILESFRSLGGPRSALGFPRTDELATPDGRGRYNHFQAGSVYWTSATGARDVRGGIRQTWASLGWERSALGYPTTHEQGTPDGRGRYNHFQSGSIYWTSSTGAREVRGAIRQKWASLGWERSSLGYPTSNEFAVPGGRATDFERGRIRWDAATGQVTVTQR